MTVLSICIPTYNRASSLGKCLLSIFESNLNFNDVEICVSDNGSSDETSSIVETFFKNRNFFYERNQVNLGIPLNFLKVVSMAKGKYVWLLGDDDVVSADGIKHILKTIESNKNTDFFLFNCLNFKNSDHAKRSKYQSSETFWKSNFIGPCKFNDIIEKNITFDHLGGMYLSVFNRASWNDAIDALDSDRISMKPQFSSHDNTFPHVRIFAKAFMGKEAYISPHIICHSFSDTREWHPYYPMVRTFRLLESVEVYKTYGLSDALYTKLRNKTLKYFAEDFIKVFFLKKFYKGSTYFSKREIVIQNIIYLGFWTSFLSLIFRASRKLIKQIIRLEKW